MIGSEPRSATASVMAELVHTINTARWSPPSPDPSGIAYAPTLRRLVVSDGEVDEMAGYFTGDNTYMLTFSGSLRNTFSTIAFSNEPTDVAITPDNQHWFFSHDVRHLISDVDLGADRTFNTSDDLIMSFKTDLFGCSDPEGLAYGNKKLFIACGADKKIFIVAPGPNGSFDGVVPAGDDTVTGFSTSGIGQINPEGIEYIPTTNTLMIVSNSRNAKITEVTLSGQPLLDINISELKAYAPAGLAYAPSSRDTASRSLYIVDRGIDNNVDPNENDGKIFEILLQKSSIVLPLDGGPYE
jgi:hypothetical protein